MISKGQVDHVDCLKMVVSIQRSQLDLSWAPESEPVRLIPTSVLDVHLQKINNSLLYDRLK